MNGEIMSESANRDTQNLRDGAVLAAGLVVVVIGSTMPSGLYSLYQQQWGLAVDKTVIVFACYAVGVVFALLFGHLADSLGRKPVVLVSLVLSLVSTSLFLSTALAAVTDIREVLLYIARIFSGLSVGLATGSFTALLQEKLHTRIGALTSTVAVSGALAVGPLCSAIVALWSDSPLQLPFWIYGFFTLGGVIAVSRVRENSVGAGAPQADSGVRFRPKFRPQFGVPREILGAFIPASLAIGCAYGVNGLFQSVVPLAASHMGFTTQLRIAFVTALMLGVSAALQIFLGVRGVKIPYSRGLIALAVGLVGVAAALYVGSALLLLLATIVCGVGQGISFKYSLLKVSEIAGGEKLAATVSSYYIVGYVGTAAGPLAAGLSGGSSAVVGIGCLVFAVGALVTAGIAAAGKKVPG